MPESASRPERVEALFHAALDLSQDERGRFLTSSCGSDAELRREVEGLLQLDDRPDARIDASAPELLSIGNSSGNLLVGRRLGPYLLESCIGSGGMGAVYRATQESPRRTVAVKILRVDAASSEVARRFAVESAFLARLQHPAIAHIYGADVIELDGIATPYIAMELVEDARAITTYADQEVLDLRARIVLFDLVCEAVQHGHQRGVIHRDLKPANILVDPGGRPKLIDFGVAVAVNAEARTRRTAAGVLLGTMQYMSPEQCSDARDLDVRSDVYSLGVVLYELLCGRMPYDLDDAPLPQAARIVQEEAPRRPSTHVKLLRGDLETILLEALEKDRERRYASAADLAADLRRFLACEPITARAPSWTYRLGLFARRHKLLAAALTAVLLVALGSAVITISFAVSESRARANEELQSTLANLAAADASLRVHDTASATNRLERIPPERRGWEWRYLAGRLDHSARVLGGQGLWCEHVDWRDGCAVIASHDRASGSLVLYDSERWVELARIEELDGGVPSCAALLPDGRVIWGSKDGELGIWDPGSGASGLFEEQHEGQVSSLIAGGAGGFYSASTDGSLRRWDPNGESPPEMLLESEEEWTSLALDPQGERLAATSVSGTVRVWGAEDEELLLLSHATAALSAAFHPDGTTLAIGTRSGLIQLWSLENGAEEAQLVGHSSDVVAIGYIDGGLLLASSSHDLTVRTWDLETNTTRAVLHGHTGLINAMACRADRRQVITAATDGTARLWDAGFLPGGESLPGYEQIVRSLAFSPDGAWLATACFDERARLHDVHRGGEARVLEGHEAAVSAVAFHPSGELVATVSNDKHLRLWTVPDGRLARSVPAHGLGIHCVAFSPDGRLVATGSQDGRVHIFDTESLERRLALGHDDWLWSIEFDPTGEFLASTTRDGVLRLWELDTGAVLWRVTSEIELSDVVFSPDGELLATAFDGGSIRVWRVRDGEPLATLPGHLGARVYGMDFSPTGDRLASTGSDRAVRLWDPHAAEEVLVLRGHQSWVFDVEFSPDGEHIASCGGNYGGTGAGVRLWSAAAGAELGH